jgi:hypothetical protein
LDAPTIEAVRRFEIAAKRDPDDPTLYRDWANDWKPSVAGVTRPPSAPMPRKPKRGSEFPCRRNSRLPEAYVL